MYVYIYILAGGFNPSERYESQLGWWHSQYMEKMFQTTNHLLCVKVGGKVGKPQLIMAMSMEKKPWWYITNWWNGIASFFSENPIFQSSEKPSRCWLCWLGAASAMTSGSSAAGDKCFYAFVGFNVCKYLIYCNANGNVHVNVTVNGNVYVM